VNEDWPMAFLVSMYFPGWDDKKPIISLPPYNAKERAPIFPQLMADWLIFVFPDQASTK
jgi:hypothetical protein